MHVFFERWGKNYEKNTADKHLISIWSNAWKASGWNIHILTLKVAMTHPEYNDYIAKLEHAPLGSYPTKEYDKLCYIRRLAIAAVGGGWIADFD
eukprot:4737175-Ditylum_brightwellii.AAC.1